MAQRNQKYLKKLKGDKPQKVNRNIEEKSCEFLRKLYPFIRDYDGQLPNLLDIFQPKAIDWLLSESVKSNDSVIKPKPLIDFVINTGYKDDEPNVYKDGKSFSRRTTPLHHAGRRCDPSIVLGLFKIYDRFDVNYTDESGLTHFHVACKFDCVDVVEKFLELGQDPNCLVPETDDSPLHLALDWYNHKNVAELLLRAGADLNLANVDGLTPLHKICLKHDELVEMFFNINDDKHQTVQIDAQDNDGNTPLHWALRGGMDKAVELLLRKGANPNLADMKGSTPLHIICWRYSENDFMEMFFKMNDDTQQTVQVNTRDKLGNTPLHVAMSYFNKKTPESLLRRGASPNSANEEGSTPLHIICQREQNNNDDFAELFFRINDDIQQTVKVDARDNLGRTPLQLAVANLLPHVIDILLDRGANLSSFVFPTESYFIEGFRKGLCENRDDFKFRLAFCALSVVERLEKRGYELSRSDALTIMNTLCKRNTFFNFSPLEIWRSDEELAITAKKITVSPSLSLYDLIQLPYEEAAKKLTYTDYFKLCGSIGMRSFGYVNREDYAVYLCEIMWREFFRRWALDPFLELTRYRLPILCCDMIIKELKNEDFRHICLAVTGQNSWRR